VTCLTAERRDTMSGGQIDKLCREWLLKKYDEEIASEYTTYSLAIPIGYLQVLETKRAVSPKGGSL
jgi:hypothetical protein